MKDRIHKFSDNKWYWAFDDEPVLLLGGTDKDNLFQWTGETLEDALDGLVAAGGNFVRNTLSDRGGDDVSPFEQRADGRYDLHRWNESYWERLDAFLEATAERDIVVELTLWDQHDFNGGQWERHAWNPVNNVTLPEESLPATGGDHWQDLIAFFRTVEKDNEVVLAEQERFVDEVLDHTLEYGHVLYNVSNEGWAGIEWERHWAEHVQLRAAERGVRVDVANMTLRPADTVSKAIEYPELFTYVELSQHNQDAEGSRGQEHWDRLQTWRTEVRDAVGPRPFNNVKIYGGFDGGNSAAGDAEEALQRFWRNVLGGCAACRFHRQVAGGDDTWGIGGSERALTHVRSVRRVEEFVDICSLEPRADLLVGAGPNEAYCAAWQGQSYLVYLPAGEQATLRLESGSYRVRYLDAETATWTDEHLVEGGSTVTLTPTEQPNQVVVLTAA